MMFREILFGHEEDGLLEFTTKPLSRLSGLVVNSNKTSILEFTTKPLSRLSGLVVNSNMVCLKDFVLKISKA
jgi:hypothetical protein